MKHYNIFFILILALQLICIPSLDAYSLYTPPVAKAKLIVDQDGTQKRKIAIEMIKILMDEQEYQKLKADAERYRDTGYSVSIDSLEAGEEVKACDFYNFDAKYIQEINVEGGIGIKRDYTKLYIIYKDQKLRISDARCECSGSTLITNCNQTGVNGQNCLSKLGEGCEFLIYPKEGSFCVNLKTDQINRMGYNCNRQGCERLEWGVDYVCGD